MFRHASPEARLGRRAVAGFSCRRHRLQHPGRDHLVGGAGVVNRARWPPCGATARCAFPSPPSTPCARKFRVTTNDVALAAITEGFRTRSAAPRRTTARGLAAHPGESRRSISGMLPYLPVEHDDSVQRLRIVHSQLEPAQRGSDRAQAASIVDLATNSMPFVLCAKAIQLVRSRLPQPGIVTLATNGPGPRHGWA